MSLSKHEPVEGRSCRSCFTRPCSAAHDNVLLRTTTACRRAFASIVFRTTMSCNFCSSTVHGSINSPRTVWFDLRNNKILTTYSAHADRVSHDHVLLRTTTACRRAFAPIVFHTTTSCFTRPCPAAHNHVVQFLLFDRSWFDELTTNGLV